MEYFQHNFIWLWQEHILFVASWLSSKIMSDATQIHKPIRWDDLVWCLWNQCAVEGGGAVTTSVLLHESASSQREPRHNKIRNPEPEPESKRRELAAEQAFISPDKGHFTGRRTPQTRQGCKPAVRCCCAIVADLNIYCDSNDSPKTNSRH